MSQRNEPVMTTATERVRPNFWKKRLLQGLLVWYAVFWVWMAIAPTDRRDWLLENLLVFVLVGVLAATYRVFPLSDLSYLLITIFLTLHGVGAHYTYSEVPLGWWIKDTFDLSRNHYDRIVHFSYGLLMAYPVREVFLRVANARGFWRIICRWMSPWRSARFLKSLRP
jgi:putative membrane protein